MKEPCAVSAFEAWEQAVPQDASLVLNALTRLARSHCRDSLLQALVGSAAELAACELSQLYLLDEGHARLTLCAEHLDGASSSGPDRSLPSDYRDAQLLQYCLCQNRTLALVDPDADLHPTSFLPASPQPWRSLLIQPLLDEREQVAGLLAGGNRYGLIGASEEMRQVYRLIGKVLHVPIAVLIQGETGTGKELVARAIHEHGSRRSRPFVVQNCAALPENLLESELFGYRKGAFSGADRDHPGLLAAADGGTLFLDEIGDMPLSLQAKLLRALQEGERSEER